MNLNEYKGRSVSESLSSFSHSFIFNTAKLKMFTYSLSAIHRVSHLTFLESSVLWEKTSNVVVLYDFTFKEILITKPQKSSSTQSEV